MPSPILSASLICRLLGVLTMRAGS